MKAFEVYVNGEKVYTAGVGPNCALHVGAGWTTDERGSTVGAYGVDWGSGDKFRWPFRPIGMGDEIVLRYIETAEADPPEKRYPPPPGWQPPVTGSPT